MLRAPRLQNKLKILAAVVTIVVIVIVMFESVVVVQAGPVAKPQQNQTKG